MRRITADPEYLRMLGAQHTRHAQSLRELFSNLANSASALSVEDQTLLGIREQWEQARGIARRLLEQTESQADYLNRKAKAFEEADQVSALELGKIAGEFSANAAQLSPSWIHGAATPPIPDNLLKRWGGNDGVLAVTPLAGLAAICGVSAIVSAKTSSNRDETPEQVDPDVLTPKG